MIADYNIGVRSTLWHEERRERRRALLKTALLYASLLLNAVLAIKLASARMGF